jgi:hypothetical protein
MKSSYHFDPMDILYMQMLRESYTRDTEELKQWLADNHMYHISIQEASSQASTKWKDAMLNALNTMVQTTATWIANQYPGDTEFIQQNQDIILDPQHYPPKMPPVPNAPNFARALQRISSPLVAAIRGYDVGKIEDDPKANLGLKKILTPTYDGKSDYAQYCKAYYSGELPSERINISTQQMPGIIKLAYQYCTSFKTRFNTIKQDCDQVVAFINQNSQGSISNQLKMDQQKLAQMQANTANNRSAGMASTNPGANAGVTRPVNADTDYHYFMEEYFEEASPTPTMNKATISGNKAAPATTNSGDPNNNQSNTNKTADAMAASKVPNGAPVDPNKLAEQKKQIMVEVIRMAIAGKLSAASNLYRNLMMVMKIHVASYRGGNQPQQPQQQQIPPQQQVQQQQAPQQQPVQPQQAPQPPQQ